jgi:uncharacterized protein YdiU (UPF0061 family)
MEAQPNDMSLAKDLLGRMAHNGADFTLVFRFLCDAAAGPEGDTSARMLFADSGAFDEWAAKWRHRLSQEGGERTERRSAMRAANPAFIPRNHLVEEAIIAAVNDADFSGFERLLSVVSAFSSVHTPAFAVAMMRSRKWLYSLRHAASLILPLASRTRTSAKLGVPASAHAASIKSVTCPNQRPGSTLQRRASSPYVVGCSPAL